MRYKSKRIVAKNRKGRSAQEMDETITPVFTSIKLFLSLIIGIAGGAIIGTILILSIL